MNLLTFENLPILEQLKLEESLLRTNHDNWVLINIGSPKAIILGISSNPKEVIDLPRARKDHIPIIQRFSGGGTVVVDEDTLFVTFIIQESSHPKAILEWTFSHLSKAFPFLSLSDNDFVIHNKKVAGNAQYIRKNRWLHHSSFLFDFQPENMAYLLHPPKEPSYRQGRNHLDFLTKLSSHISKKEFSSRLLAHLSPTTLNPPIPEFPPHRTTTTIIRFQEV